MRMAIVPGLVLILTASVFAQGSEDNLSYFLSRSNLVVLGKITSEPARTSEEVGVVQYSCDFQIADSLSAMKPNEESIHVNITRFELDEADRNPELKKGCKCILFLKNVGGIETPKWETFDVWFGFQRPSPSMAKTLKRLASEKPAERLNETLIPVVVRGKAETAVVKQGEPIPLAVTIANDLQGTIEYHSFDLVPNDWNGETVNMTLVDVHRDGKPEGLFAQRPKMDGRPAEVAGIARHLIKAGERLTIKANARKWQINGGWIPGKYSVNVRVERVSVDGGRHSLSILSEPFDFEIR